MKNYPSNITREEFELIREDLENARKRTKPRKIDLYEVFCAILYVLKSGCQWDMLPSDFPKKSTVFYYFQIWTKTNKDAENQEEDNTILDRVLKKIGRPIAYRRWKARMDELLYHWCPERPKCWYSQGKGLWCGQKSFGDQTAHRSRYEGPASRDPCDSRQYFRQSRRSWNGKKQFIFFGACNQLSLRWRICRQTVLRPYQRNYRSKCWSCQTQRITPISGSSKTLDCWEILWLAW